MSEWKKTSCVLCTQNCGLEVLVENNRIVKARGDKDNPRSEGYICRKGVNIAYFQHHDQRLTHPLKKVGNDFVKISWEQAITEIAEKLRSTVDKHGPRSLAFMGMGGQGGHSEAVFGIKLLNSLGSKYYYNALAAELTGMYWGYGRTIGRQYNFTIPDHHNTDMLLAIGWNGWMSHQMPQARRFFTKLAKDPNRLLVVIDPRRSETAEKADIHLALRPGTDALLTRALIAIILQNGWQNQEYIDKYVSQFDKIEGWFKDFDAREACGVCGLDYDQVKEVARLFATRKSSIHPDLGVFMNRHSSVTTYLQIILLAICGRLFVEGGNVVPGYLMTMGAHTDDLNPKNWRTVKTGYPPLLGMYPPNVLPEEINNDHPERVRAVVISYSNPVRSYADTTAFEEAFDKLDLLVTIDIAMSETARMSHYILPDKSPYERWDTTYFQFTYPEVYSQLRRPVLEPKGECLESSEIFTRIAEKLGIIPEIPESLYALASKSRLEYGLELMKFIKESQNPGALPFVVAKTLGKEMGSANLAWMWTLLQTTPKSFRENAARVGFKISPTIGEDIFKALIDHPEGIWIGKVDPDNNFSNIKTDDNRINLYIPDVEEWVKSITPEAEERELQLYEEYPFILMAGRHMDMNANTLMRNPEWNRGRRACTLAIHPDDAEKLGLKDEQIVKVTTEAGSVNIEVEVTTSTRPGMVIIPHGFGLEYNGQVYGVAVNRLTKTTHRDPIAGTPLHRYVLCRIEAV